MILAGLAGEGAGAEVEGAMGLAMAHTAAQVQMKCFANINAIFAATSASQCLHACLHALWRYGILDLLICDLA